MRVRRDFGPLVQNASQAQGKHGSDPLASQLARKIRERLIRHGISHRVGRNASWDSLSSPGLWLPLGRKWAQKIEWENNGDERGPAFRGRGGRCPATGILTRFRRSFASISQRSPFASFLWRVGCEITPRRSQYELWANRTCKLISSMIDSLIL